MLFKNLEIFIKISSNVWRWCHVTSSTFVSSIFHVYSEVYVFISRMWICLFFFMLANTSHFGRGRLASSYTGSRTAKTWQTLVAVCFLLSLFHVLFKLDSTSPPRSTIWSHFPSQIPPQELFLLQKVSQQNFLYLNTSETVIHFSWNCSQSMSFSSYLLWKL